MITVYEYDIVYVVSGSLYYMAPNFIVRNIDVIMNKFVCLFRDSGEKIIDHYLRNFDDESDFEKWIDSTMRSIKEFRMLNLSQNEINNGITDPDDPKREEYFFVTGLSSIPWMDDFVDLDAAIQFIINGYYHYINKYKN